VTKLKGIYNKEFLVFLEKQNQYYDQKDPDSQPFDWDSTRKIFKLIQNTREESYTASERYLGSHVSIANLAVACYSSIAFGLFHLDTNNEKLYLSSLDRNLFPPTWLNSEEKPNPNLILLQFFCQISNLSSSIVHLCEIGQDHSARILMRALDELCQLVLIIMAKQEDFRNYAISRDKDDSEIMRKNFSKKKRFSKLAIIEKKLGLAENESVRQQELRDFGFSRYSASVHGAPITTVLGSMVWSFAEDRGVIGIVGGCNKLSESTLSYFIRMSNHFFFLLFGIIQDINKLTYPTNSGTFWLSAKRMSKLLNDTIGFLEDRESNKSEV